jgi:hypothetical protein
MRKTSLIIAVLACCALPAVAQTGSPSVADAAQATRNALEEARILRGVNRVGLTPEQLTPVQQALEQWERGRQELDKAAAPVLTAAAAAVRQSLDQVDPAADQPTEAEANYARLMQEYRSRQEDMRRKTRELLTPMLQGLSPGQAQALQALAREDMLQIRLAGGSTSGDGRGGRGGRGGDPTTDVLQDLERIRQSTPEDYQRRRDMMARQYAGAFNRDSMRQAFQQRVGQRGGGNPGTTPGQANPGGGGPGGGGPGGRRGRDRGGRGGFTPPPITDPAMQQRVAQFAAQLDRIRAMAPAAWQSQRATIAAQFARSREASRVQSASPEELTALFLDRYLLSPRSPAAIRARLGGAATAQN